jgi:hypothetical protein
MTRKEGERACVRWGFVGRSACGSMEIGVVVGRRWHDDKVKTKLSSGSAHIHTHTSKPKHVHRLPQRRPEPACPGQALGEKPRPRAWWPANPPTRHGLPVFGVKGVSRSEIRTVVCARQGGEEGRRGGVSKRLYLLQEPQGRGLAKARGRAGDEGRDITERHALRTCGV